jgi:hypothetical protein
VLFLALRALLRVVSPRGSLKPQDVAGSRKLIRPSLVVREPALKPDLVGFAGEPIEEYEPKTRHGWVLGVWNKIPAGNRRERRAPTGKLGREHMELAKNRLSP